MNRIKALALIVLTVVVSACAGGNPVDPTPIPPAPTPVPVTLSISPSAFVTLALNQEQCYTGIGGREPYTWRLTWSDPTGTTTATATRCVSSASRGGYTVEVSDSSTPIQRASASARVQ